MNGRYSVRNEWSHGDLASIEPIGHRQPNALFFDCSRRCAAPVERTLGKPPEHVAAKEITNAQTYETIHDHFSWKVARRRLLDSLRETPGRPRLRLPQRVSKGVK